MKGAERKVGRRLDLRYRTNLAVVTAAVGEGPLVANSGIGRIVTVQTVSRTFVKYNGTLRVWKVHAWKRLKHVLGRGESVK